MVLKLGRVTAVRAEAQVGVRDLAAARRGDGNIVQKPVAPRLTVGVSAVLAGDGKLLDQGDGSTLAGSVATLVLRQNEAALERVRLDGATEVARRQRNPVLVGRRNVSDRGARACAGEGGSVGGLVRETDKVDGPRRAGAGRQRRKAVKGQSLIREPKIVRKLVGRTR